MTDPDGRDTPTVHLHVTRAPDRRLLADRLGERYAVREPDGFDAEGDPDVRVLDAPSLRRYRDDVAAAKADAAPVFRPVLLLVDADRTALPRDVRSGADAVLSLPVDPDELDRRLDGLVERRRLSLALERRNDRVEARFRALFEAAPDPMLVTTPDGVVAEANETVVRTLGIDRDAVVGRDVAALPVDPDGAVERLVRDVAPADDEAGPGVIEWPDAPGGTVVTEARAAVVDSESADRIVVFRDVTDREEREAALNAQNERLEEFASTIAHDLRNPLTIAEGYLDMADDGGDDLAAVRGAHDRMGRLIDELLALARGGHLVLEPEPVALSRAAREAWRHTETGNATLAVDADATVRADESRLKQLFENLFRNAVEHSSTGPHSTSSRENSVEHGSTGSRSTSSHENSDGSGADVPGSNPLGDRRAERAPAVDGVRVRVGLLDGGDGFSVADDGPGIPAADRESVFEAGYTTTDDGTGFGLSIVRQIVDGHDWDVSVTESAAGGARFEFAGVTFDDDPGRESEGY